MSRHRNIRSMNYSEEYEGFDDVYGHSVEEDYCVSPSVAEQFIYDRNKRQQMSAFLGQEEEIAEEDEEEEEAKHSEPSKSNVKGLNLSDIDQARLQSCLEEVRNVIGDSVAEQTLIDAALRSDFNVEKVLNLVLNNATEKDHSGALKPMKTDLRRDKDDCSSCNSCSSPRDRVEHELAECFFDLKELGAPEKCNKENVAGGIESSLSQKANNSVDIDKVQSKTGASAEMFCALTENSLTNISNTEFNVVSVLPCSEKLLELGNTADNVSDKKMFSDTSTKNKVSIEAGDKSNPITGDLSDTQTVDKLVFQPDLKFASDSDEDDFSSLCSLVIHNRSSSSEFEKQKGLVSPAVPPTLPTSGISLGDCSTSTKPAVTPSLPLSEKSLGDYSLSSELVGIPSLPLSGKSMELCSSPLKPVDSSKEHFSAIGSDSEEDEDFSSLCSLVIHNRSSSSDFKNSCGTVSSMKVPVLPMSKKDPDDTSSQQKSLGFPNQLFEDPDSDSEDENYSSLCSLVVRNRSHPSDVSTKFPSKEPFASVPSLNAMSSGESCAQSEPFVSAPSLNAKSLEESCVQSKPMDFLNEPIDEQGSDSEEDNFSSLCSLIIHNRNSSSEGSTKLTGSVSHISVPSLKETEEIQSINEPCGEPNLSTNKFIIPPLVVPANMAKESEILNETSGLSSSVDNSNQCSEDEDYVIDLCSTVKLMEINRESPIEEEVDDGGDQAVETVPYQFMTKDDFFALPLNECGISALTKGPKLLDISSANLSPFGKILCRKWECLVRAECPQSPKENSINVDVVAFMFDTESPDDTCRRLRSQKYLVKVETAKVAS